MVLSKVQRRVLKSVRTGVTGLGRFYEINVADDERCYKAICTRSNWFMLVFFSPVDDGYQETMTFNGDTCYYRTKWSKPDGKTKYGK